MRDGPRLVDIRMGPCREIRVAGLCVCLRARPARSCLISSKVICWANILAKDESICGVGARESDKTRQSGKRETITKRPTRKPISNAVARQSTTQLVNAYASTIGTSSSSARLAFFVAVANVFMYLSMSIFMPLLHVMLRSQ